MLSTRAPVPGCELKAPVEPEVFGGSRYIVLPTGAGGGADAAKGIASWDCRPSLALAFTRSDTGACPIAFQTSTLTLPLTRFAKAPAELCSPATCVYASQPARLS